MSLLDTINAAKEEAKRAGTLPFGNDAKGESDAAAHDTRGDAATGANATAGEKKGALKSSSARAKPAREKAAGVREASKKPPVSQMSKVERRRARAQERDDRDRRLTVSRILLNRNPEYRHHQHITWSMLGTGFAAIVCSWIVNLCYREAYNEPTSPAGMVVIGLIVVAYALVIISFIYDIRTTRPLRRITDDRVAGMTTKKLISILNDEAAHVEAEKQANPGLLQSVKTFFRR